MKLLFNLLFVLAITATAQAQVKTAAPQKTASTDKFTYPKAVKKPRYNIAVLTPMYLDSFKLADDPNNIPAFAAPGIDFYVGAQLAADTLDRMGTKVSIHVLDSKGKFMNLENLIAGGSLDSADCIIGNIGGNDLKIAAEFAKSKKINFISAVSPSDANQFHNPYFTLLQPRLSTHIQRLHKLIDLKYSNKNVIFIHKDNEAENNAFLYYKNDVTTSTNKLKEIVQPSDELDMDKILPLLDKGGDNLIVLANLNAKTALQNLESLHALTAEGYPLVVFGMPTWENIRPLRIPGELDGMEVYFTSPVLQDKITQPYKYISKVYKNKMKTTSVPDIAYKGFEAVFYIANMLEKHGVPFNENISDNEPSFVTPYRISVVKENNKLKYYENKFLYVVHYSNGILTYE